MTSSARADEVPRIQKLSHDARPGGKTLALYGRGFGEGQGRVTIGKTELYLYRWSDRAIDVLLPDSLPAGKYTIKLETSAGQTVSKPLTLLPRVAAFEIDDSSRPYRITILGSNFGRRGKLQVAGEEITIAQWSPNQIEAIVPEHIIADWHDVFIHTGGTKVLAGQFGLPPDLSAISVTAGTAGTEFTLSGLNFGSPSAKQMVVFGDWHNAVSSPVVAWSPFAVTATVSRYVRPGKQPVWLWIDGVPSQRLDFTVVPAIQNMTVGADSLGDIFLFIRGHNFGPMQVDGGVRVGGLPSVITSWNERELIVQVPNTLQPGDREVVVVVGSVASDPALFRIAPPDDTIWDGVWRGKYEKPEFDEKW